MIYHYHIWKLRLFDESSLSKEFFYKFLLEKTAEIKAAGHRSFDASHMTGEKTGRKFSSRFHPSPNNTASSPRSMN